MKDDIIILIIYIILLSYLIICSYSDLKTHTINLWISILYLLLGFVVNIYLNNFAFIALIISTLPGLFLLITSLIFPHSLGTGDGIIFIVCGIYLGISTTLHMLILALILSCTFSIILIIKKHSLKYQFPFAPFILTAYIFIFCTGTI